MTKKAQLPKIDFESILVSIKTKDTYDKAVYQLTNNLVDVRDYDRQALNIYKDLVENQMNGQIPSQSTLISALSDVQGLNFQDKQIFPDDEVLEKVDIYIERKKNMSISQKLLNLSDEARNFGLTNNIVEYCTKLAADIKVENTYVPVSDTYKEVYNQQAEFNGISFLVPELNRLTGGMAKGTVCTILGGPASMKTTTAVNICYNAAKEGRNIAYLSLEETPFQLFNKLMSRVSVDVGKPLTAQEINQQKLEDKDKKVLMDEVVPYFENMKGNFYIVGEQDLGNYNLSTFESKLKEVDLRAKQDSKRKNNEEDHGIDIVVVDHIQLLKFAESYKDEFSVINMYVSFFRQQSLSFLHQDRQITVILLSQANREGYAYAQKHDGAYRMQHVAEANELERASSYIISVYTDQMNQISKLLKVGTLKLRGAALPLDTVNVFADGQFYQVGETDIPEQTEYSASDLGITTDDTPVADSLDDMLGDLFS